MARRYLFADECGNFDFSNHVGASRYFILVTVTVPDCAVGDALLSLRRELAWSGVGLDREFHATTDAQPVRDRVFATLAPHAFRVDATVLEKAKAQLSMRHTEERFYRTAWWLHMKYIAPHIVGVTDELLVVSASLGTKRKRAGFHAMVQDVVGQVLPAMAYRVACWEAVSDPCLQVADYCAWAIQRKWERSDRRSHVLIASKIVTEFAAFDLGAVEIPQATDETQRG
jgi:hypothetical protein